MQIVCYVCERLFVSACAYSYMLSRFLATCIFIIFSEQKIWYSAFSSLVMWSWCSRYHSCFSCSSFTS